MDNNNQEMEEEEMAIQEADEKNMQVNAKYTKICYAQQCCFRMIFLISICSFISLGFCLASIEIPSAIDKIFIAFLSGLVGSILLKRVFLTNTRTDRTSSIDYILSSQEVKERIIEMYAFEAHDYSYEFILKDVNKHLPLNSRQS
ncbi:21661_t:CDS:1 [Cetraspora pellucida]|uniref:21661_t:CDS:1 n=1 Tax=Cetraspora pellucida TaxID=1433469 RepID=A0A9N9II55_9GLOM|nr:21661_t:CDS:1 [Cetraspora pellucida]